MIYLTIIAVAWCLGMTIIELSHNGHTNRLKELERRILDLQMFVFKNVPTTPKIQDPESKIK